MSEVSLRWVIRRDLPAVVRIESQLFEFPWDEEEFIRVARMRNCICMVAVEGGDEAVRGFVIYELHQCRLHILSLAVAKDHQRRGIGRLMVERLVGKLNSDRRNSITLEVRETNLDAQLFFRRMGFRAESILRDFYDDSPESAYQMRYRCKPPAEDLGVTPEFRSRGLFSQL